MKTPLATRLAPLAFTTVAIGALAAGCSSSDGTTSDSAAEDLRRSTAVNRAMEWVNAKLAYCQSPNHQHDPDTACSSTCNRTNNASWNPYRSDCSGLVSWAWELSAPGRTTFEFAPHQTDITYAIKAENLKPGDAVNYWQDHVMLFKKWDTPGKVATFIEEPGCSGAIKHAREFTSSVSVNGSSIYVSYNGMTFTAIRYKGI